MTNTNKKPVRYMDHNDYVLLKNRILSTTGQVQQNLINHMAYLQNKFDLKVY